MYIETLNQFIEWTAQFNDGRYLFRGVSKDTYKIEASAYRRLPKAHRNNPSKLLEINKELIENARSRGHDQKNGQSLSDLELLAELQHFGAATCLIDFSRSALVALWFACQQSSTKEEANGKVFAVYRDRVRLETVNPKLTKEDIDYFLQPDENDEYRLYQWEPKLQNNRIIAQHSVFIFGGAQIKIEGECVIVKSCKQKILESLEELSDITEANIFPDFDGFARVHAQNKPRIEPNVRGYRRRGIEAHQRGDLDAAIEYYTQVISLDPDSSIAAEAYNNRGLAYASKREYDCAIKDLTKGIDLTPDDFTAYYNRSLAYHAKREYDHAIADYTQAIDLNPNYANAYYGRGGAYKSKSNYDHAIADYTQAIDLNPNHANAYYYRGVVWLHLQAWEDAKSDLTTARDMGVNIINEFHNGYESVAGLEQITGIQLPADIAAMLTPQR